MEREHGAEQFSSGLLPTAKTVNQDGIKVPKLSPQQERKRALTVWSKVCFAIGGAPYQITGSALGFFLQIFLLDVALLDPLNASVILFVGRAWDAVTDPTVGFLVSRTPWTRHGRMMPWILISTTPAVLCYFLIWVVPPIEQGKMWWYLLFYCLFQTLQTCFHVPYSALTMFISTEQKERDSATAYRKNIYTHYNRRAYMIASAVISLICVLCAVVLFFGVTEQDNQSGLKAQKHVSFRRGLRLVMSHGPYVKLVLAFLFTSLAFMLMEGNFALFIKYTLGFREDFQNILLVIMLSATLTIPMWQWFLCRFGKKTAVYIGITWAVPFMIVVVCVNSNLFVSYIVSVAAGASVAAAFLLPWSMLPDVVDDFKVQNPTSQGHEAIFYSFYVFFTKFASGVSLGVSTLALSFAGYVPGVCVQSDSVNLTLKMLVSAAPVSLIALGLLVFKTYPINEERRQYNNKQLQLLLLQNEELESEM
ncbi:sodium-dependent lysophosphatidylcholine symporter 1-A-like [Cyprinus carpio]|uniref:Sodium-dependent lysophosphatidylcholine symporter 1-A-like n=1 Tax=Cyprinus carpio TaxID=7962 RepID=A0A9R0B848_CYPCA|nr:sodium-dependent lysophosphatidylcholine symporter 1-A-like [Cyprinus carpio]